MKIFNIILTQTKQIEIDVWKKGKDQENEKIKIYRKFLERWFKIEINSETDDIENDKDKKINFLEI